MSEQHLITVARAALPEVMFAPDVGVALRLVDALALEAILDGTCGPYFWVGDEPAVLRESFLRVLGSRAGVPPARTPPKERVAPGRTRRKEARRAGL